MLLVTFYHGEYLYIGDTASIACFSNDMVDTIIWELNGSIYNGSISNISISNNPHGSNLLWYSVSELYNNTIVNCGANYSDGTTSTSNEATILLQGMLLNIFICLLVAILYTSVTQYQTNRFCT